MYKIVLVTLTIVLIIGCADTDIADFVAEKPQSIANREYLNDYASLKSYVNRTENPNFKLGCGVSVGDFNKFGLVYRLACANFDEITAGNAMKYSSCVADDGSMDFSSVSDFVEAAQNAGLTIYGHTLCWHSQQNIKYLNSLVASANSALHMKTLEAKPNVWDWQIAYALPKPMEVGVNYTLKLRAKASSDASINFWPYIDGGATQYEPGFSASEEWADVAIKFTAKNPLTRLQFVFGKFAGDLYFDDLSLTADGSDENLVDNGTFDDVTLPGWSKPGWHSYSFNVEKVGGALHTPQENADTLTWAMDKWISGMMEACKGYVTAWDVVNEPLSGVDNNNDGLYDLQSVNNVSAKDARNSFYWQDYLGDDYARIPIRLARKYGPENMKLFINDYNLESDWDNNNKLKSLIKWIERWESDGETKIDGIGTQMHVSYYVNSTIQKSKEEHIIEMFNLLAATGKLIKISELDMGLVNESGESVLTENITEEQHKAMAEFYKFIIEKYFEIIPAAQRYGITQWAVTDSPINSSWRKGQPTGLWDLNYKRKHTYAGFADGLSGK